MRIEPEPGSSQGRDSPQTPRRSPHFTSSFLETTNEWLRVAGRASLIASTSLAGVVINHMCAPIPDSVIKATSVDSLELKSTPLRLGGAAPAHNVEPGSLVRPSPKGDSPIPVVEVPKFAEAAIRRDASKADANATRSRNNREAATSAHRSKVNIPSKDQDLQVCKQAKKDGTACPNTYRRTRRHKMCRTCFLLSKGFDVSSETSLSRSSSSGDLSQGGLPSDDESASHSDSETEPVEEPDLRMLKIYTKGSLAVEDRGVTSSLHFKIFVGLGLSIATLSLKRPVIPGVVFSATALSVLRETLVWYAPIALRERLARYAPFAMIKVDGGARRDPRLSPSFKNIVIKEERTNWTAFKNFVMMREDVLRDCPTLPFTKDEMQYLGFGGSIDSLVDWNILLWLRSKKRVKITKNNAKAILAYILAQYPATDLNIARNTTAYFLQELQQDDIYLDHHTVLSDTGAPPSYPDGHWRPN